MSTTPPPIPIRGPRLTITEAMLRSRLVRGGITGSISSDLTAVCRALKALETQTPQMRVQAVALSGAFNRWLSGNHPGELSVLMPSVEFQTIQTFVSNYAAPNAPPAPPPLTTLPSRMKSIGVALYTVKNANFNFKLTLDERLRRMRVCVKALNDWLGTVNQTNLQLDNSFTSIFLAPEYFFTRPNPAGTREYLDLAAKNTLDIQLRQLSLDYPKTLLVPGTIHYDVQLSNRDKVEAGYKLLKAAKDRILREKALARPRDVLTDAMSHAATGPNSKVPSMNEMAAALLDPNSTPRRVHNVTSLLLNGRVWGSYDKHTDFYESKSTSPDQSMFVPGTQDECPEIGDGVRKFRFGVEICFDHGNGVLKHRSPGNLHFHLVVSDSVPTDPAQMAMKNSGYFLHASTDFQESVIWRRRDDGQLVNETNALLVQRWPLGADFLEVFLIQLPVSLMAPPPRPPRA